MSAIGFSQDSSIGAPGDVIGAHADYRRDDFIFPRTQSIAMRGTPWKRRIKRVRSWSEISGYAAVACAGALVAVALI